MSILLIAKSPNRKGPATTGEVIASALIWGSVLGMLLVTLSGCVNYVKVEKTGAAGETCRATVRGNFMIFTTHAALEECRPDGDR